MFLNGSDWVRSSREPSQPPEEVLQLMPFGDGTSARTVLRKEVGVKENIRLFPSEQLGRRAGASVLIRIARGLQRSGGSGNLAPLVHGRN